MEKGESVVGTFARRCRKGKSRQLYLPSVTSTNIVPSGHTRVGSALGEGLRMVDRALVVVSSGRAGGAMRRGQGGRHQGGEYNCSDSLHVGLDLYKVD